MASRRKFATGRQSAYIVHLENLTGMRSQGPAGNRIRLLPREAQRQKIPDYKWKPLPVKKTKDPSIVQPSRRRKIIDRSTREFYMEPEAVDKVRQSPQNGARTGDTGR